MDRLKRQKVGHDWALRCFGDVAIGLSERATRVAEEAIELAQCEGVDRAMLHKLVDHVYDRPVGLVEREVGGVGLTLIIYCEAKRLNADACEENELNRVLSKTEEHFRQRQNAKAEKGIASPTTDKEK
jgi:hypothetical protein